MKKTTRRSMIKQTAAAGLAVAGAALLPSLGISSLVFAAEPAPEGMPPGAAGGGTPDIVAVKGENLAAMYAAGIKEIGGLPVKKGDKVVIKPNIGWAVAPDGAANTSPALVVAMIRDAFDKGASSVHVFDHTCDDEQFAYEKSGIKEAAEKAGATVATGDDENDYKEVDIPGGKTMKKTKVHRLILESDAFFNVPVLKHHRGAGLSCAMKNMMGAVWDRRYFHLHGLNQCVADSCLVLRPQLNVIDAYKVMLTGGPRSDNSSEYKMEKMLILAKDIVAADVASARTYGADPADFAYIAMGRDAGIGRTDIEKLDIKRMVL